MEESIQYTSFPDFDRTNGCTARDPSQDLLEDDLLTTPTTASGSTHVSERERNASYLRAVQHSYDGEWDSLWPEDVFGCCVGAMQHGHLMTDYSTSREHLTGFLYGVGRNEPCPMVLVEDSTPFAISTIGRLFNIEPEFFRDHLTAASRGRWTESALDQESTLHYDVSIRPGDEFFTGSGQGRWRSFMRISCYRSSSICLLLGRGQSLGSSEFMETIVSGRPLGKPPLLLMKIPEPLLAGQGWPVLPVSMLEALEYALQRVPACMNGALNSAAAAALDLAPPSLEAIMFSLCYSMTLGRWLYHTQDLEEQIATLENLDTMELTQDHLKHIHGLRRTLAAAKMDLEAIQRDEILGRLGGPHGPSAGCGLRDAYGELKDHDIPQLSERLNDLSQFFISATNLQDAKRSLREARQSRRQAERATILTVLATIYLPLSLFTGIFGMNIKEINGGTPTWVACGEALAVAVVMTGAVYLVAWYIARRRNDAMREEEEEGEEEEEEDDLGLDDEQKLTWRKFVRAFRNMRVKYLLRPKENDEFADEAEGSA